MIYNLNRDKALEAIIDIVDKQDNNVLQELYHRAREPLTQTTVLKVWNKLTPLDSLSDEELEELFKICSEACKTDDYKNCLVELDTSSFKMRYLETITSPKFRVAAMQYLELFTELIESVYHKDLCKMTFGEAIEGLSRLPNLNASSVRQALTVARGYCKWCQDSGEFDGKARNIFKNIRPEDIPIDPWVKKHIVKDAGDLVSRIEQKLPISDGNVAIMVPVLSWLGFDINVCPQLKIKDVSITEKIIFNRVIPDEFVPIVMAYINVTSSDNDNDALLRKSWGKLKNSPYSVADLRNSLRLIGGLTYSSIRTSSLLFNLFQKKKSSGIISNEDFIEAFDLKPNTSTFSTYLKDKKRLYDAYERIYWG